MHIKSNKFLTVNKRLSGAMERNTMRLTLDLGGNEGSWFSVLPFYKHRNMAEAVIISDKVVLRCFETLHASDAAVCMATISSLFASTCAVLNAQLSDHADCMEVNVAVCTDSWRISLFQEYRADAASFLKVS